MGRDFSRAHQKQLWIANQALCKTRLTLDLMIVIMSTGLRMDLDRDLHEHIANHLQFTDGNVLTAALQSTAHYSCITMPNREEVESDELCSLIRRVRSVDQIEDLAKMNTQSQSAT
jgi:hypothetical protein